MAGSDRYSLIVESQTRGEQALNSMAAALSRFTAAADKASRVSSGGAADPAKAAAESARKMEEAARRSQEALRQSAGNVRAVVESPLQAAGQAAENFVLRYGKVGVGVLGGAAALAVGSRALLSLVEDAGGAAEAMANLADRTGLSLEQVDRFSAMARIANVNVESLATGGRTLAKVLQDTGAEGAEARKQMRDYGLALYDAEGNQRNLGDVLEQTLSKLSRSKSETELLTQTTKLLGKSGSELLPLIRNFGELDRTAKELGFGSRSQLLQDLARADDAIDKLGLRWEIVKGKLAQPAAAVVNIVANVVDAIAGGNSTNTGLTAGRSFVGSPNQQAANESVRLLLQGRAALEAAQEQEVNRQRAALSSRFSSQLGRTESGQQARIREIEARRSELLGPLQSGTVDADAFRTLEREFNKLGAEQRAIEAAIKANAEARANIERLGTFQAGNLIPDAGRTLRRAPSLFRGFEPRTTTTITDSGFRFATGSTLQIGNDAIAQANQSAAAAQASQLRALGSGLIERETRTNERRLQQAQMLLDYEARRTELLAGPGGEIAALEKTTALRLQQIDLAQQLGQQIDAQAEKTRVLQDAELKRLEILNRQRDQFKNAVGSSFDALLAGGNGLRSFGLAQLTGFGRTIATNVGGELFTGASRLLAFPGQKNADGSPSFIGRLLAGTPFADNGLKSATDANTAATIANTAALRGAGGVGGGSGVASLSAALGLPDTLFGGSGRNPLVFSATPALPRGLADASSPINTGIIPGFPSASSSVGFANQYGSRGVTAGVYAAALAGGAAGVYAGVQQGGARGVLTAAASGLGAAAALDPEPVSKAVLAIAAAAAGIATQLLPNPKVTREKQIDAMVANARFSDPGSQLFDLTFSGQAYDTNVRGDVRPQITIQVNALDASSIMDRAEDIGDAVMMAMDRGHRLNRTVQTVATGV